MLCESQMVISLPAYSFVWEKDYSTFSPGGRRELRALLLLRQTSVIVSQSESIYDCSWHKRRECQRNSPRQVITPSLRRVCIVTLISRLDVMIVIAHYPLLEKTHHHQEKGPNFMGPQRKSWRESNDSANDFLRRFNVNVWWLKLMDTEGKEVS